MSAGLNIGISIGVSLSTIGIISFFLLWINNVVPVIEVISKLGWVGKIIYFILIVTRFVLIIIFYYLTSYFFKTSNWS